ncbi:MAG: SulP family inorganic anion transporter [Candidatus Geothermincolia bacterium]
MAMNHPKGSKATLHKYIPSTEWLPAYQRKWLAPDIIAGLTVWALLVPEAMAYAGIAGVPPQYGLYAAPFALIAYAVFGRSKHLSVGPSATVAVVSASTIAPLAISNPQRYLSLTIVLALITGVVLIVSGLARMGFIAKFLAKPVLDGFIIGLAVMIAAGQVGKLLGVSAQGETAIQKIISIFQQIGKWDWLPFVIGVGGIVALLIMGKYGPRIPGALVVVAITTLLAYALSLQNHGLSLVGAIPRGLPSWQISGVSLLDLVHLLPGALAVALVGFSESIAIAKDDANKYDYRLDIDQEMVALGISNIGAGLSQGFAVDGSLSKTAAAETAGAKTQVSMVTCAIATILTILFLSSLFKYLPEATLGAIVIHALWKYFRVKGLERLWRVKKGDFVLSVAALCGVVFAGVMPGIIIGVVLSLVLLIKRWSDPHSAVLGRDESGTRFGDINEHPDYSTIPGVLIFRYDAPLVFPNVDRFASQITELVEESEAPVKTLILDCEVMHDMDTTASDQFLVLLDKMKAAGVRVVMARLHAPVRDFMKADGLWDAVGDDNIFPTVRDAVASI